MKNENKIKIPLKNGRVLTAALYNHDGDHPEITITLDDSETGLVEQDIALVRVHEEKDEAYSEDERIDVLVWGDAYSEEYTEQHVIDQYFDGEDEDSNEDDVIEEENIGAEAIFPAEPTDSVVVYSDGACSGNPGPGGWGVIVLKNGVEMFYMSGGASATTNNRMELTGVIEALKLIPEDVPTTIISDSQYVVRGMNEWIDGWVKSNWINSQKKPVLNDDLWKVLYEIKQTRKLTFEWVKGHNGNPYNVRCDKMAVAKSKAFAEVDN